MAWSCVYALLERPLSLSKENDGGFSTTFSVMNILLGGLGLAARLRLWTKITATTAIAVTATPPRTLPTVTPVFEFAALEELPALGVGPFEDPGG